VGDEKEAHSGSAYGSGIPLPSTEARITDFSGNQMD
jgi:hypothetical protein